MSLHSDKVQDKKSQSIANTVSNNHNKGKSALQFHDNRPEAVAQRKLQEMAEHHSAEQYQPIQKKENNTGLPDNLKSGVENLSGLSMDDVKVHYNSDRPAQLQAHAYAQGTDIHLGSGQEKHLPHEAWHVVQQKQGRVKPTMQMKGGVNLNDDKGLENEADLMGTKALQMNSVDIQKNVLKAPTEANIQLKRLRSDLKMGNGNAGQWHKGDADFHVTVFSDDPSHSGSRGFPFISDLWVSEFHTTRKQPFGRKFYNIDNLQTVKNQGNTDAHNPLAQDFYDAIVDKTKMYSEDEAHAYQDKVDKEKGDLDQEQLEKAEAVILEHANIHAGKEINWDKVEGYKIIGAVSRGLREKQVIMKVDIEKELQAAINKLNDEARKRESEAMEEKLNKKEENSKVKQITKADLESHKSEAMGIGTKTTIGILVIAALAVLLHFIIF